MARKSSESLPPLDRLKMSAIRSLHVHSEGSLEFTHFLRPSDFAGKLIYVRATGEDLPGLGPQVQFVDRSNEEGVAIIAAYDEQSVIEFMRANARMIPSGKRPECDIADDGTISFRPA